MEVAEPRVSLELRQEVSCSSIVKRKNAYSTNDFFKFYSLSITPKKMVSDPRTQDKRKVCNFHNDYGHLTIECHQLK